MDVLMACISMDGETALMDVIVRRRQRPAFLDNSAQKPKEKPSL